jgi:hypothetical protein
MKIYEKIPQKVYSELKKDVGEKLIIEINGKKELVLGVFRRSFTVIGENREGIIHQRVYSPSEYSEIIFTKDDFSHPSMKELLKKYKIRGDAI